MLDGCLFEILGFLGEGLLEVFLDACFCGCLKDDDGGFDDRRRRRKR